MKNATVKSKKSERYVKYYKKNYKYKNEWKEREFWRQKDQKK